MAAAPTLEKTGFLKAHQTSVAILLLLFVAGGVFGFVYEELFYLLNDHILQGGWRWEKRGSTFGPWIQIYGFGSVFIFLSTHRLRERPWAVFLVSGAVCGVLEYFTGLAFDKWFGIRSWDYNVEIWNWGNLDGYVCARSVLFFAASGLVVQYLVYPLLKRLSRRLEPKVFLRVSAALAGVCVLDMVSSTLYDTFLR